MPDCGGSAYLSRISPLPMYNRRHFLRRAAAAGVYAAIGTSLPACARGSRYQDEIGLQLYTLRNQLERDPLATLTAVRDIGYRQVELMDTIQLPELLPIIRDLGLGLHSSFINWSHVTGGWEYNAAARVDYGFERVIEDAQRAGLSELVFGWWFPQERDTADKYKATADKLNAAGEQCRAAGIQLCYHNHAFEFADFGGQTAYDILIERLDPDAVQFELDVFWASLAGVDPLALMQRLDGRIHLLHLKDKLAGTPVIKTDGPVPEDAFQELGTGVVDIDGALALAPGIGVRRCFVEQDQSPDPLQSVRTSYAYLEALG